MPWPLPTTDSISSYDPTVAPVTASVITCSRDGVCPSGCHPLTTVSQASRPCPELASTNSSGVPTASALPTNRALAAFFAAAAVVLAEVARVSGAASPTELPAYVPFGAVWMTKSPPYTRRPW